MSDPRETDWTADASRGWLMDEPAAPDAVTDPGRRVRTPGPSEFASHSDVEIPDGAR